MKKLNFKCIGNKTNDEIVNIFLQMIIKIKVAK